MVSCFVNSLSCNGMVVATCLRGYKTFALAHAGVEKAKKCKSSLIEGSCYCLAGVQLVPHGDGAWVGWLYRMFLLI